jgi:Ca2+-binding EF-hand superfamily protein
MEDKSYKGAPQPTSLDKQITDMAYENAKKFVRALDQDKDGTISFEEFSRVMRNNLNEIVGLAGSLLLHVMRQDRDGDGKINVAEAMRALSTIR